MLRFCLAICLLISPLGLGICSAAHPLITDDAGTMGRGKAQIEVNGEYERERDHGTKERTLILSSTLSYGVVETGDFVLSVPYLFTRTTESGDTERERGVGDMMAEFKWRCYEKDGLSLAVKPGLLLPSGNDRRGLGAGKVGYQLFLIATEEVEPFTFHGNMGYMRSENTLDQRKDLWHVSVAGELPATEHVTVVANVGMERDSDPSSRREQTFFLGGLIWALSKSIALDGGLKYSTTTGAGHSWSLLGGFAYQF